MFACLYNNNAPYRVCVSVVVVVMVVVVVVVVVVVGGWNFLINNAPFKKYLVWLFSSYNTIENRHRVLVTLDESAVL